VINDILDFSKIEARKLDLEIHEFNLRNSLEDTMKSMAFPAHRKGLELACHVVPELDVDLMGDAGRLRQIVVNLVNNAIKFTERGEVVLSAEVAMRTEEGIRVHFQVTDTGVGIRRDQQKLVFEAFTQADGSSTRKYGGTGLGLTISSLLVQLMSGSIWVESELGQGSSFHFTAVFNFPKQPSSMVPLDQSVLKGLSVLVVDDNATNLRILQELLENWGCKPTCVDGGEAALCALRLAKSAGKVFPLILTDSQMPGMDGFMLVEEIQREPELIGSTIMMLTSSGRGGCEPVGGVGVVWLSR